jgi:toxin ParE1/3/4
MKNYRLSAESQDDLRKIKGYSLTTWGKRQTQNYLAAIETTLETLTVSPELGKNRDEWLLNCLAMVLI